jgi:hypothetical protein
LFWIGIPAMSQDIDKRTSRLIFEVKPGLTRQNALMILHQGIAK